MLRFKFKISTWEWKPLEVITARSSNTNSGRIKGSDLQVSAMDSSTQLAKLDPRRQRRHKTSSFPWTVPFTSFHQNQVPCLHHSCSAWRGLSIARSLLSLGFNMASCEFCYAIDTKMTPWILLWMNTSARISEKFRAISNFWGCPTLKKC